MNNSSILSTSNSFTLEERVHSIAIQSLQEYGKYFLLTMTLEPKILLTESQFPEVTVVQPRQRSLLHKIKIDSNSSEDTDTTITHRNSNSNPISKKERSRKLFRLIQRKYSKRQNSSKVVSETAEEKSKSVPSLRKKESK